MNTIFFGHPTIFGQNQNLRYVPYLSQILDSIFLTQENFKMIHQNTKFKHQHWDCKKCYNSICPTCQRFPSQGKARRYTQISVAFVFRYF